MSWPRISLAVACVAWLWAQPVAAAVAFDAKTVGSCHQDGASCTGSMTLVSGITATIPITIGAGSDMGLVVAVFIACRGVEVAPTTSTVAHNGVSMTSVDSAAPSNQAHGSWWKLNDPATGTHNIVATLSGSVAAACTTTSSVRIAAISASGTHDDVLEAGFAKNSSTGATTATVTISTNPTNSLGVNFVCAGSDLSAPDGTQRDLENTDGTTACSNTGSQTNAPTDVTYTWTIASSDTYISFGGSLKAAGAGAASTECRNLLLLDVGGGCTE
jgi:hypothetical protein